MSYTLTTVASCLFGRPRRRSGPRGRNHLCVGGEARRKMIVVNGERQPTSFSWHPGFSLRGVHEPRTDGTHPAAPGPTAEPAVATLPGGAAGRGRVLGEVR